MRGEKDGQRGRVERVGQRRRNDEIQKEMVRVGQRIWELSAPKETNEGGRQRNATDLPAVSPMGHRAKRVRNTFVEGARTIMRIVAIIFLV